MKIRWTKENKVLYCNALRCETIKNNNKKSLMSNLQTYYHFKLDFQKLTNIEEANG